MDPRPAGGADERAVKRVIKQRGAFVRLAPEGPGEGRARQLECFDSAGADG